MDGIGGGREYATAAGGRRTGAGAARTATYAFLFGLIFWAVILFAVAIGTSLAFRLIGSKWNTTTLGYTADPSVITYTDAGMEAWAAVADITPVKGGTEIEVVLKPLLPPVFYAGQPAQANVTQANGRITHCEVRLDPVAFAALNEASQQATVTHELGHCLGLDHSDAPGIMMNPYFYAFGADDAAGVASLYGAAKPGATAAGEAATATSDGPESRAFAPARPVLEPGWNLVTWGPDPTAVGDCGCAAVYRAEGSGWRRWLRGGPRQAATLDSLEPGVTYWVLVNEG